MAEVTNADLEELLAEPREALDVEVKEWLDLATNDHRAALAKEIIALANHGGGYIIIGFEEQADGSFEPATARPPNLDEWSQDRVQSIVAKYVDPAIQCRVQHRTRGSGSDRFPVISVPGGHRVPVRAKSGSPDGAKLVAQRIYVRRPGPNSEEPRTAEEWDRLIERCVQNRQAELVEAMRMIMAGVIPTAAPSKQSRAEQLAEFERAAVERWESRVAPLPQDAAPRLPSGHYDVGIAIDGTFDVQSLPELRATIASSVRNHSGWPPFLTLTRDPFAPKAIDGAVEFWRGPDTDGSYDKPAHHDFWRVSPDGLLFTRRGLPEDGGYREVTPGTSFDITTPTWRIGEAILQASYIAKALNAADANLICHCRWVGLAGRQLVSYGNPNRLLFDGHRAEQNSYEATETVAVEALPQALPEVVFAILRPLYELFDFFQLPKRLVEEELASLQRRTF
ncbi:helix-turn-helix domain-containing protein [Phenylobacterium sp.]|jgi:hypothetical protein|uniref:helix-turn-helix domain-containing protein n=1 Tax=Phenylobacterium sp. TaxID=1871053 RepID=UPI0037840CFF